MYSDTYFHLQLQNFLQLLDSGGTLPNPAVFTNWYQPALPQHVWLRHLINGQARHLCRAAGVMIASKAMDTLAPPFPERKLQNSLSNEHWSFTLTCETVCCNSIATWSSVNMGCNEVDEANKKVSWDCKQCRSGDLRIILSPYVHLCPMEQHAAVDGPDQLLSFFQISSLDLLATPGWLCLQKKQLTCFCAPGQECIGQTACCGNEAHTLPSRKCLASG